MWYVHTHTYVISTHCKAKLVGCGMKGCAHSKSTYIHITPVDTQYGVQQRYTNTQWEANSDKQENNELQTLSPFNVQWAESIWSGSLACYDRPTYAPCTHPPPPPPWRVRGTVVAGQTNGQVNPSMQVAHTLTLEHNAMMRATQSCG